MKCKYLLKNIHCLGHVISKHWTETEKRRLRPFWNGLGLWFHRRFVRLSEWRTFADVLFKIPHGPRNHLPIWCDKVRNLTREQGKKFHSKPLSGSGVELPCFNSQILVGSLFCQNWCLRNSNWCGITAKLGALSAIYSLCPQMNAICEFSQWANIILIALFT